MRQRRAHFSSRRSPVRHNLLPPRLPEGGFLRERCRPQTERRAHPFRQGCHRDGSTARLVPPTLLQEQPWWAGAALDAHEQRTQLCTPVGFVAKLQQPIGWPCNSCRHPCRNRLRWLRACYLLCVICPNKGLGSGSNSLCGSIGCPAPKAGHRHPPPVPGSGNGTRVPPSSGHPHRALRPLNVDFGRGSGLQPTPTAGPLARGSCS